MKNYYDMSKVDFVVDRSGYEIVESERFDGQKTYHKGDVLHLSIEVQINGGRLTLVGDEAKRFIGLFEEYQQNKEKGLVK